MRDRPPRKEHDWDDYPPGDSIDFATACYPDGVVSDASMAKLEWERLNNPPTIATEAAHIRAAERLAAECAAIRAETPLYCEPTHRYPMEVDEEPPPDSDDKAYQS